MTPHIQETAAAVANKATTAGSATTVLGWATGSDIGMWVGITIGLLGLAINFYYKRKSDRRAAEAHAVYMDLHRQNMPAKVHPPKEEDDEDHEDEPKQVP